MADVFTRSDRGPVAAAYEEHAPGLRQRIRRALRDDAAAEDVVQEAFVRLVVQVQTGPMPENIGGWLHRVAMNLVASSARRARTARLNAPRLLRHDQPVSPETSAEQHELVDRLSVAVAGLTPADRFAIELAARGIRRAEMARRLGRTEEATRALLSRARSKLRAELQLA
jgi:RNA polymerase sigma-70 factor (ECF subfamily)